MKKILTLLLATCLLISSPTMTLATSAQEITDTASVYARTLYLNDWADFDYGTSLKSVTKRIPRGNHILEYSVTKPTDLVLWVDSYTSYTYSLSGDGTKTIYVPASCSYWSVLSSYSGVSCSFVLYDNN